MPVDRSIIHLSQTTVYHIYFNFSFFFKSLFRVCNTLCGWKNMALKPNIIDICSSPPSAENRQNKGKRKPAWPRTCSRQRRDTSRRCPTECGTMFHYYGQNNDSPGTRETRTPKERFYARRPPYPLRVLSKPYPERYEPRAFTQYNGRKGGAVEHVSKFIDTLSPYAADEDLLPSRIFQITMRPSIHLVHWPKARINPDLGWHVDVFCTKYFHGEETVTLATLQATKQRNGENLMEYIKRFRDIALDLLWSLWRKNVGGNVYDKHDQGVQSSLEKFRNLPVCTVVAKGQKYCPVCEAKFGQKKRLISYGSIY